MTKRLLVPISIALLALPLFASAASCPNLYRNLSFGSRGQDVVELQTFLIAEGDLAAGNNTGYFGRLTVAAVQKWQARNGLVSSGTAATTGYGAVGPRTRAAIARVCAGSSSQPTCPPYIPTCTPGTHPGGMCDQQCLLDDPAHPPAPTCSLNAQPSGITLGQQSLLWWNSSGATTGTIDNSVGIVQPSYSLSVSPPRTTTYTLMVNGAGGSGKCSATVTVSSPNQICEHAAPPSGCSWIARATCAEDRLVCASASSCSFNGQTISDSQSVTAYSTDAVPFGQQCQSQQRTCSNGTLSGSYAYATCAPVTAAASCTLDGATLQSGTSKKFYSDAAVGYGNSCETYAQTRTCQNGTLNGSSAYNFSTCIVGDPNACSFNGQSVAHGAYVSAYQSSSVPFGSLCSSVMETRMCQNGILTGSYQYASCTPTAPASCSWNGQTIAHNQSVTVWQAANVPYGSQCVSQTRTCQNGTLSNSYVYASCSVGTAASCTLDGATVASGSSRNFYSAQSVTSPNTCSSVMQSRTCTNGALSGSSSYQYATCITQTAATTITPQTTSATAGSTLSVSWNTSLSTQVKDWIGTVPKGRAYLDYTGDRTGIWFYTDGAQSGTKTLTVPSISGEYEFAYFVSDSYTELARSGSLSVTSPAVSMKVMSFNMAGSTSGSGPLSQTAAVILSSGADVVGIQERGNSMSALLAYLPQGWSYREFSEYRGAGRSNSDTAVLTRYPIVETFRTGVRVQVAAGKEAYIFTTHLWPDPYEPYNIRDGSITSESQAVNSAVATRGAQMNALLGDAASFVAAGKPVFVTGDFNEPSHLDWTSAAASAGLHAFKVAWPTSVSTLGAGFKDSYRIFNASEIQKPGITWTPRPSANEVNDRIDFVYFAGTGVQTTNSQVVCDSTFGDIVVNPYPSDHCAVVSTFFISN